MALKLSETKLLKRARTGLRGGALHTAIAICAASGRAHPQNAAVKTLRDELARDYGVMFNAESELSSILNLFSSGAYSEIVEIYDAFPLSNTTDSKMLLHCVGAAYFNSARFEESLNYLRRAEAIAPGDGILSNDIASALVKLGRHAEAIPNYRVAMEANPRQPAIIANMAEALRVSGDVDRAIELLEKARSFAPENFLVQMNLGAAYFDSSNFVRAQSCLEKASQLAPDNHVCLAKLGEVYHRRQQLQKALVCFIGAARLDVGNADYLYNASVICNDLGQIDDSLQYIDRVFAIVPDHPLAMALHVQLSLMTCSWDGLSERVDKTKDLLSPMSLLYLLDSPDEHLRRAKTSSRQLLGFAGLSRPASKTMRSGTRERIRLGYFSSDFRGHPVSHVFRQVLQLHDRNRFEVSAFSFCGPRDDAVSQRIRQSVDVFHDVTDLDHSDAAALARAQNIDIAIDLNGLTRDTRPEIFAHRAAPIQINFLGYPGTTGSDFIDAIIADEFVIPAGSEKYFSEKVFRLEHCYLPYGADTQISDKIWRRSDFNLPEAAFVFSASHNYMKILPEMFDSWMRILHAVNGSVLWLLEGSATGMKNLKNEARKRGIEADRLIFMPKLPISDHLARLRLADLYLDTFPYGAHTTGADALYVGVPMVSRVGKTFGSRVGASLLSAVGLGELAASCTREYEDLSISIANNPAKLSDLQDRLRGREALTLFDTPYYVRSLERVLEDIADEFS